MTATRIVSLLTWHGGVHGVCQVRTADELSYELSDRLTQRAADRANQLTPVMKRAMDLSCGLILLLLLIPVFLLVAIGVRCSGKQIVFAHKRIGQGGRTFRCFKFRSMYSDADARLKQLLERDPAARKEWAENFKLKDDPRVTRFGAILRRTSLDELPQLFNVVAGHMCLVGPRPVVEDELVRYGRYARFYLLVRPGMTGLWQVSGRSDTSYRRRVALDCTYVRSQSLQLDLKILLKTIVVVWRRQSGAY